MFFECIDRKKTASAVVAQDSKKTTNTSSLQLSLATAQKSNQNHIIPKKTKKIFVSFCCVEIDGHEISNLDYHEVYAESSTDNSEQKPSENEDAILTALFKKGGMLSNFTHPET